MCVSLSVCTLACLYTCVCVDTAFNASDPGTDYGVWAAASLLSLPIDGR
jgi:hypothetical protein